MKIKNIKNNSGFTLIELVMVIIITAILATTISVFITRPVREYTNMTQRAELVDAADLSLRRMARDIQRAVPNSVRVKQDAVNNRWAIEMVNIVEGMRYRAAPTGSAGSGPFLNFTLPITTFNTIGQFQTALTNASCAANNCRVVVYSTGANTGVSPPSDNPSPGANVYSTSVAPACGVAGCLPPPGSVTITPVGTTVTLTNPSAEGNITLGVATQFALPSPKQRLYIVDTPISYICDTNPNTQSITRYSAYTINQVQPINPAVSPLNTAASAQLTKDVSVCSFAYAAGTAQRNGVVTMTITVTKGGETITLMRQVNVNNAP